MAVGRVSRSDSLTRKLWGDSLEVEVLKKTTLPMLAPKNRFDGVGRYYDKPSKRPGDNITFGARRQMDPDRAPKVAGEKLEGNERRVEWDPDELRIDDIFDGHRFDMRSHEFRVDFDLREEGQAGVSDVLSHTLDVGFHNHICGFTPANDDGAAFRLHNDVRPATHIVRPDSYTVGSDDGDEDIGTAASDEMSLDILDSAKEVAVTRDDFPMRKARVPGVGSYYVVLMHPHQATSLRKSDDWKEIQHSRIQGGELADNPFFAGGLGTYNEMLLVESHRITNGVHSDGSSVDNVRRAVLLGAGAFGWADGRIKGNANRFHWEEVKFGYTEIGMAAFFVTGLVKLQFGGIDHSVITIPTHAEATANLEVELNT